MCGTQLISVGFNVGTLRAQVEDLDSAPLAVLVCVHLALRPGPRDGLDEREEVVPAAGVLHHHWLQLLLALNVLLHVGEYSSSSSI